MRWSISILFTVTVDLLLLLSWHLLSCNLLLPLRRERVVALLTLWLGVRLESIVECMGEGSNVALRSLPVTGVSDLGSQRRSQTLHHGLRSLSLSVVHFAQTKTRSTLRNRLRTHAHRRVNFAIVDVAHVGFHVVSLGRLFRSCRGRRPGRRGHCCGVRCRQ